MTAVIGLRALPHLEGSRIDLSWMNPPSESFPASRTFAGIRIVRRERAFPLTHSDGDSVYPPGSGPGPIITGFSDRGLRPLTTYYYTVFASDNASPPDYYADEGSRVAALATKSYGLPERLYDLLPAVHKRLDLPLSETEVAALDPRVVQLLMALPPALRSRGQLWRFLSVVATPLDLIRSFSDVLPDLHDVDRARPEFLDAIAQLVGWDLDRTLAIAKQRNEVRLAPRLHRTVGTAANLSAIAGRYSGWYTQIAEFAQQIVHSNVPPDLNLFAMQSEGAGWRGSEDAAPLLGFTGANSLARGSTPSVAATLTSSLSEPFALRPNIQLAVTADERLPVVVRFRPGDFADMSAATASEVAAVVNRTLTQVSARALTGRIEIRSHTRGPDSSIRVEEFAASLLALEGAPRSRLSTFVDAIGRLRVFYVTSDPLETDRERRSRRVLDGLRPPGSVIDGDGSTLESERAASLQAAGSTTSGEPFAAHRQNGRVRYRTFRERAWGRSYSVLPPDADPQADVAALALPDGRIWAAWVAFPDTGESRIRTALGSASTPLRGRLVGQRAGPFNLPAGSVLTLRGAWDRAESVQFPPASLALPSPATAAQIAAFVNPMLRQTRAVALSDGRIAFETPTGGEDSVIAIDLDRSTAAEALGFAGANALAVGDAGDRISWGQPEDIPSILPGRHADLFAALEVSGTSWRVRLFWSTHEALGSDLHRWHIREATWDGTVWSAPRTVDDGAAGNREPCAVIAGNTLELYWSQRAAFGDRSDMWTLQSRTLNLTTDTWSPPVALTTPPVGGRVADREPAAVVKATGTVVYFSTDRLGSSDIWRVSPGGPASAVTADQYADRNPAPVDVAVGVQWLLFRSDRSVSHAAIAARPITRPDDRSTYQMTQMPSVEFGARRSLRTTDIGSVRKYSGRITLVPSDLPRLERRRQWDELLSYTPLRPDGDESVPLGDDDFYTHRTIGLYVSPLIAGSALAAQTVARLKSVLRRYLPINVRAVVVLSPRPDIEFVYDATRDIEEAYLDDGFLEPIGTPAEEAAVATGWIVFLSNTLPDHRTADAAHPTTLRHRSYFRPPV